MLVEDSTNWGARGGGEAPGVCVLQAAVTLVCGRCRATSQHGKTLCGNSLAADGAAWACAGRVWSGGAGAGLDGGGTCAWWRCVPPLGDGQLRRVPIGEAGTGAMGRSGPAGQRLCSRRSHCLWEHARGRERCAQGGS